MKGKCLFFLGFLLCGQLGWGQFVHIHFNNNDSQTRPKLGFLIGEIGARVAALETANKALEMAIFNHQSQLFLNYTKNGFDKDNFLTSAAFTAGLSVVTDIVSGYKMPYMTAAKRKFIRSKTERKAVLLGMAALNNSKIKSGKRQEVYRERKDIIKGLSKNDRESRALLLFSALGLVVSDPELLSELLEKLEGLEFLDALFQETHTLLEQTDNVF